MSIKIELKPQKECVEPKNKCTDVIEKRMKRKEMEEKFLKSDEKKNFLGK
jgi:hypothetical protein